MVSTLVALSPVLFGLVVGFVLRLTGVAKASDGEFLLRLLFYVMIPALMFSSLAVAEIEASFSAYPVLVIILTAVGWAVGRITGPRLGNDARQIPVTVIACMLFSSGTVLAFADALYGPDGVARVAAFDAANHVLAFTWIYAVAARGNPEHSGNRMLGGRLARNVPLYAIAAGLVVNVMNLHVPGDLLNIAADLGSPFAVLITVATGIIFTPVVRHLRPALAIAFSRLLLGLVVGLAVIYAFDLEGLDRTLALLLCVAPTGYNTVTFASLEKLDTAYGASVLSVSLLVGLTAMVIVSLSLA